MLKKLSRRRFFAAATGAAVAPALASQLPAGQPPSTLNRIQGGSLGEAAQTAKDAPESLWAARARLERIARGDLDDWQRERVEEREADSRREAAAVNIDALRSVSASVKRLMYARHLAESTRRNFMDGAMRELRQLLRRGA